MSKCSKCQPQEKIEKVEKCDNCGNPILPKKGWHWQIKPVIDDKTFIDDKTYWTGCMHEACPGCRSGTCNGVHVMSCPCPKCSPRW